MRLENCLGATAALLVTALATGPAYALGPVRTKLSKNGHPIGKNDLLSLDNGVQIKAEAYQRVVETYLTKLKQAGRVSVDAVNHRLVVNPVLKAASVARTSQQAAAATKRALALGPLGPRSTRNASAMLLTALKPGRPGLTATRTDRYRGSWSESLGDPDWAWAGLAAEQEVLSSTSALSYSASLEANASVFGNRKTLVSQSVLATAGRIATGTGPGSCMALARTDVMGQTIWAYPLTSGATIAAPASSYWNRSVSLVHTTVSAMGVIPIELDVSAHGELGMEAMLLARSNLGSQTASELLDLQVFGVNRFLGSAQVRGAYAILSLSGGASTTLTLRQVASQFGIEGVLEGLEDLSPGFGVSVDIPWNQPLAEAGVTVSVDLVNLSLDFGCDERLHFESLPASGSVNRGTYSLVGQTWTGLSAKVLSNPRITGKAYVSYPDGVDVDLDTCWGIPCGVKLRLEWNRIGDEGLMWGAPGATLFSATVPVTRPGPTTWNVPLQTVTWTSGVTGASPVN